MPPRSFPAICRHDPLITRTIERLPTPLFTRTEIPVAIGALIALAVAGLVLLAPSAIYFYHRAHPASA